MMTDKTESDASPERLQSHRTIDRVTRILEEVVYAPGITFTELVHAVQAPKSSVHSFVRGLVTSGWLYEDRGRFYLGPAVYGLTMASGQIRAGAVTNGDLNRIYNETGVAAFLGVRAGDHLIYVAEGGNDQTARFYARTNIRRPLHQTAAGKALLASQSDVQIEAYFRRTARDDMQALFGFLDEMGEI
ncbi:MAG: helix-turn-helix domain-containing protein, partial [Paracoccus sp. (in: a-proteobacteria)]